MKIVNVWRMYRVILVKNHTIDMLKSYHCIAGIQYSPRQAGDKMVLPGGGPTNYLEGSQKLITPLSHNGS